MTAVTIVNLTGKKTNQMQKLQSPPTQGKISEEYKVERMSLEVICKYCPIH